MHKQGYRIDLCQLQVGIAFRFKSLCDRRQIDLCNEELSHVQVSPGATHAFPVPLGAVSPAAEH